MKKRFYVIDEDHLTSYSPKADASEVFATEARAHERAKTLAESEPGKKFYVCLATHYAECGVERARLHVA